MKLNLTFGLFVLVCSRVMANELTDLREINELEPVIELDKPTLVGNSLSEHLFKLEESLFSNYELSMLGGNIDGGGSLEANRYWEFTKELKSKLSHQENSVIFGDEVSQKIISSFDGKAITPIKVELQNVGKSVCESKNVGTNYFNNSTPHIDVIGKKSFLFVMEDCVDYSKETTSIWNYRAFAKISQDQVGIGQDEIDYRASKVKSVFELDKRQKIVTLLKEITAEKEFKEGEQLNQLFDVKYVALTDLKLDTFSKMDPAVEDGHITLGSDTLAELNSCLDQKQYCSDEIKNRLLDAVKELADQKK